VRYGRVGALATGGAVVLVGLLLQAPGGPAGPGPDGAPVLVYVSGLDDHLLDAYTTVPLHSGPDGPVVAGVPAGTLVWVHPGTGAWVEVTVAEGAPRRGWMADYFLRGRAHLVDPVTPGCPVPASAAPGGPPTGRFDPSTLVRLHDLAGRGTANWVLVEGITTGSRSWVARDALSERPGPDARRVGPGVDCERIGPREIPGHSH
jgi:hypothetical protein